MNTATHYENANFLRELAESLPRIRPQGNQAQVELLQRLADDELAQAVKVLAVVGQRQNQKQIRSS